MIDTMDLFQESHRIIYRAMSDLHRQGRPIDLVTTTEELKTRCELEGIGGAPYLMTLIDYVPTAANVAYYCRTVKEKATVRRLRDFAATLATKATAGGDLAEVLTDAKDQLREITSSMDSLDGVSVADLTTVKQREEHYQRHTKELAAARFKTGFQVLDQDLRGVAPGEVLTLAAYSGTFKTAFLQNLLLRGAESNGWFHLFFSLEMPAAKVYEREIQIQGEVSGREVEEHFTGRRESAGVLAANTRTGSRGLMIGFSVIQPHNNKCSEISFKVNINKHVLLQTFSINTHQP